MSKYEWRLLQRRDRWTMGSPYEEWFRPVSRDFSNKDLALEALRRWRRTQPEGEFKLQSRIKPVIREWKDIRA